MINSLLTKVAGLFDKDYLFAAFLPSLIFHALIAATLAVVVGLEHVVSWIAAWSPIERAILTGCAAFEIVVFGYVLNALRGAFLGFWSGTSRRWWSWGFRHLGEDIQRWRFRRLRRHAQESSPWDDVFQRFRAEVDALYDVGPRSPLTDKAGRKLTRWVAVACAASNSAQAELKLQRIVQAYETYAGGALGEIYRTVKQQLSDRHQQETMRLRTLVGRLDRQFGTLETVRPTALGNVIEAYSLYPWKRYCIEAEIFWPRLRKVMPVDYAGLVQDQQTLLDFTITMASLAGIYGLVALVGGPWLWFKPILWLSLAAAALLMSIFFYGLSVQTAERFGDLVRSSFDLFRLDLMAAFHRPFPATLEAERAQWRELSALVVYGTAHNFTLIERQPIP